MLEPEVELTPLNFAIVGAGRIAHSYVEAFGASKYTRVSAVMDTRIEAAASIGELLKVESFYDADVMLASKPIDAVVIATPPHTHCELGSYFLERGIHVLCEKPVSMDSSGARRMRDIAEKQGVVFTMASKFRYVEDVNRAKSIVTSGLIGNVISYENTFASYVDMSSRWNSVSQLSGGGVFIDNGSHSVDIIRYFFGGLDEIQVIEAPRMQNLGVEETVHAVVLTRSGILATVNLSWSVSNYSDTYISIYGSQGTLHVGWKESRFQQLGRKESVRFGTGYNKVKAFSGQLDNFAAAILNIEPLLITADDAIASVEAIEAGYASVTARERITVGDRALVSFS